MGTSIGTLAQGLTNIDCLPKYRLSSGILSLISTSTFWWHLFAMEPCFLFSHGIFLLILRLVYLNVYLIPPPWHNISLTKKCTLIPLLLKLTPPETWESPLASSCFSRTSSSNSIGLLLSVIPCLFSIPIALTFVKSFFTLCLFFC